VTTIGIDIGGRSHAVARCRTGVARADREVLRITQTRAGFAALDAWLERQAESVDLVTMESSGHYWMALASHLRRRDVPVAVVNPLAAKYFAKSRLARTKSDRPMPGASPRWPCATPHLPAIRSAAPSCAKPPGSR